MNWNKARKIILKNKKVCRELENNKLEYKIIEDIILIRKKRRFTQKQLAELVGTKQSNISRLENGNYNPTLGFLNKIAVATGKKLKVSFA